MSLLCSLTEKFCCCSCHSYLFTEAVEWRPLLLVWLRTLLHYIFLFFLLGIVWLQAEKELKGKTNFLKPLISHLTDGQNSTNNFGMFGCVGLAKLGRMEGRSIAYCNIAYCSFPFRCDGTVLPVANYGLIIPLDFLGIYSWFCTINQNEGLLIENTVFQNGSRKIGIWASKKGIHEYKTDPWKIVKSEISFGGNSMILTLPWGKRFEAEAGGISSPRLHFSMCFAIGRQSQPSESCFWILLSCSELNKE